MVLCLLRCRPRFDDRISDLADRKNTDPEEAESAEEGAGACKEPDPDGK